MTQENDLILSKLTVRLRDCMTLNTIGSGILYFNQSLKNKVYILTAAHNLYKDPNGFEEPINSINIDIFNSATNSYQTLLHTINYDLVSPDIDKDVAVLLIDKSELEVNTEDLPLICPIRERLTAVAFTLKGFPNATLGEELACINPAWLQKMTGVDKFQLQLVEDYSSWATQGFSGSGVFLCANNQIYLYGIFTRFRSEGKGKVIYCQYIETVNEILRKNYLPHISFAFFGEHGLTATFFKQQVATAIKNLGPRFNEELNFRLPIARQFNDLAKDHVFKQRFLHIVDKWLSANNYGFEKEGNRLIVEIEDDYNSIKKDVTDWIPTVSWEADKKIEISEYLSRVNSLNENIEKKRSELYDLQRNDREKNLDKKREYSYHQPYEKEINRLHEILRNNYDFSNEVDNINITLSNYPCLIIKGDAGCGKSHLLGDIANERNKNHQPTLLLLGQLFRNGQNVWQNVISQLNLSCSKDELLNSLNSIGQQTDSRVLILIDALNEGAGKEIWPFELAGFINDLSKSPFIGLALTVRSTYYNTIVPVSIQKHKEITILTHEGFKGNEYEALHLFCQHYELEQPNFPILAPEFSNPLLLQLICEGLKNSGQTKFPQGIQGISEIFNFHLNAICDRLVIKRDEYRLIQSIIRNAIQKFAIACFNQENRNALLMDQAIEFFDNEFPKYPHLLSDLIFENVLIQSIVPDYGTGSKLEVVYFSFERFGDFQIAENLLKQYTSNELIRESFEENNKLGRLLKDGYWRYKGIMEAFSVLLPEKYNLEITEVYQWAFEGEHDSLLGNIDEWLSQFLIDSLKWRTTQSIDNEKLTKWFNSDKFYIDDNNWFNSLIELTTQKDHPFNGDRLFRILKRFAMPKRDSFWQQYLRFYSTKDDDGNAFPIKRLIDWAWQPNISGKIDTETARLTGQTLAWVLSSTNIVLRDQTTKAMVNLLEEQPDALINLLHAFKDIDDVYILERLYGIAYGCALRTSRDESLQKIAQYVFDTIFKGGNPQSHILLRDYARNTIEYAIYKNLPIVGDVSLIKPPFKSRMPANIINEAQLKDYEMDHEAFDFKKKFGAYHNRIMHSVIEWDFGRYIVDSALTDFCPVSFTMEDEYKDFLRRLPLKQRKAIKLYEQLFEQTAQFEQRKDWLLTSINQATYDEIILWLNKQLIEIPVELKRELNEEEYLFFLEQIIPHISLKQRLKDSRHNFFDSAPIKRWIVQRVFELGYIGDLHGSYDSSIDSSNNRSENKIERIGKKYQWIGFYEIMAMIADNYKIKEDRWSNKTKYKYYSGAWQGYLRDVDPIFTTMNREENDLSGNDIMDIHAESKWWSKPNYDYWNLPDSQWVDSKQDLPDLKQIILIKDESNQEWLYLKAHITWEEPKLIGEGKYSTNRKEIWYSIQSYLVRKNDKTKIKNWLEHQNFWGRWLPDSNDSFSSLFNRENYWSPASKANGKELWRTINGNKYRVMVTTSTAVGELSQDKSNAHFRYYMPCKRIFEGMNLQYAPKDGEFKNGTDEIVVVNPDFDLMLIRKNDFVQFLNDNNLEVIWALLGEKNAIEGNYGRNNNNFFKVICGVYTLDNCVISGSLMLHNRK